MAFTLRSLQRTTFVFLGVALGVTLLPQPTRAIASPTDQLRVQVDRVLAVLEKPTLKSEQMTAQRRVALRNILSELFDFEEIARRALGRHWAGRTAGERVEFVRLFTGLVEETYLSNMELYGGETIRYGDESMDGSEAIVRTRIIPNRGEEVPVAFRMRLRGEQWRVYDVVINGVSLVDNYRAQLNRLIQASSYAEVIAEMQRLERRHASD